MNLFGTSGIRGIVDRELTKESCREIGQSVGTLLPIGSRVCLATDTRLSRDMLKSSVTSGLLSCGIDVVDLGILPTPALARLTRELGFDTGVMITASHDPPEFNGIKLFNADSLGYDQKQEAEIENIFSLKSFRARGEGRLEKGWGAQETYLQFLSERFSSRSLNHGMRIIVDPGNGAACGFASDLLTEMGVKVIPLNDEPNGLFPGRNPEPREDTLVGTVKFLQEQDADLAVCFDGDADRVVFCDRDGFLGFNEMIAFISRLAVQETGRRKVATTVETGRLLDLALRDLEVEVIRGRVGDVNVAYLAKEVDAAVGVEGVGVYIFPEAGYYSDSFFAILTLLNHIKEAREIRDFIKSMPKLFFKKSRVICPDQLKQAAMEKIKQKCHLLRPREVNTLDGVRLEFDDSWLLIRASGTEPVIRVIAESTSESKGQDLVTNGIQTVQSTIEGMTR